MEECIRTDRIRRHRLDVYIWDYLTRRGFARAAKALISEAGMTEAPDVPLKTPQGLLFESVYLAFSRFLIFSPQAKIKLTLDDVDLLYTSQILGNLLGRVCSQNWAGKRRCFRLL